MILPHEDRTPPSSATLRAGCKLNIFLRITGVLPNGYHAIRSVMVPLREPFDTMRVDMLDTPGFLLECSTPGINPQDNTLSKAYRAMQTAGASLPGMRVTLEKGIPHGAGLGGGSADAAVFLRFLNERAGKTHGFFHVAKLSALAAGIGADVPFFLHNVPSFVTGYGDKITPLKNYVPVFGCTHVLLLCPNVQVETAWAYRAWDAWAKNAHPYGLTRHTSQDTKAPAEAELFNSFETVVFERYPQLAVLKRRCIENGASGALMSGSGSSIFGLFRSAKEAERGADSFKNESDLRVFVTAIDTGASPSW